MNNPHNHNTDPKLNQIFRILFIGIGCFVTIASIAWCETIRQFINNSSSANGVVIKLNAGGSHPEIRFTTQNGKVIEYPQNGFIFGYEVGDQVTVLYNPQQPKDAVIDSFGALWGFPILGIITGISFIGVALAQKYRPDLITFRFGRH